MSETLTIALAQTVAGPDREANRARAGELVRTASTAGAALIAFPEMAFDPFFPQHPTEAHFFSWAETVPGPTSERFARLAAEHKIAVFLNLFQAAERGQYFDATVALAADGEHLGVTQMLHICETPGFHEKFYYWPGRPDFPVFPVGEARVAPVICYDRHYPEVIRILALRGADLILVQTATTVTEAGTVLEVEMQAAALANGVFVALVNRAGADQGLQFAGRSFVVNPAGKVIARSTVDGEDVLVTRLDLAEIAAARHEWPFLRDRRADIYGPILNELEP
jgi:N-carbamoylputrescine amidase